MTMTMTMAMTMTMTMKTMEIMKIMSEDLPWWGNFQIGTDLQYTRFESWTKDR